MIDIKTFICALLILLILVGGFVTNYYILKNKSLILIDKLETLKTHIDTNDEKKISDSYLDFVHQWKKHNKYMLVFSNHTDPDGISLSLIRTKEKLAAKDYARAKEEIEIILASLSSIPRTEIPYLENIF